MLRVLKTGKPANWGAKKDEKEWAVAIGVLILVKNSKNTQVIYLPLSI
jgi:hypothetical protein